MSTADPVMAWEDPGQSSSNRFANPLTIAWRHRGMVFLGLFIGLLCGAIYYSQATPVYQSTAQVLVIKKRSDVVPGVGTTAPQQMYVEDYLTTHAILIGSQPILHRAADIMKAKYPGVLPNDVDSTRFFLEGLKITREYREGNIPVSNVLNLSFRSQRSEDCAKVLNSIIEAYRQYLNETFNDLNREFADQMRKAQETLSKELKVKRDRYEAIARKDPLTLVLKAKDVLNSVQSRMTKLEEKRVELEVRQAEIRTYQRMIADAKKSGKSDNLILKSLESRYPALRQNVSANEVRFLEDQLAALEVKQSDFRVVYGQDHPQWKSLQAQIQSIKDRLAKREPILKADEDPLDMFQSSLESEYSANQTVLEDVNKALIEERTRANQLAEFLLEEEQARKDIEPYQALLDSILQRLRQIQMASEAGGYEAQTILDAGLGVKVAPNLILTLVLSTVVGLMLGMGLAYLGELTDRGFRTPEEIRQTLGVPVIGHIPPVHLERPPTTSQLDPTLIALHNPRSRAAESFRGVRTALYFSVQGRGHQVIQITSPTQSEGKSTALANLAISIAQSGKTVILVDGDFRRPVVHRLFRLPQTENTGLVSLLAGDAELPDVVKACPEVPGLHILPCGPRPNNPAELLASTKFQELITMLRDRYDFVLIDSPPVLAVSDPAAIAPLVDGVILLLRLTKNVRPLAIRARAELSTVGANVLGVLVNAMSQNSRQFGYGYTFQYGYSYGYQYGYDSYEESKSSPSFPDLESKPTNRPT